LGNDFVILDRRDGKTTLSQTSVRAIADRRSGIGCDQLIIMEPATTAEADVFMRIYNPDGSEAGACGNATRCVAELMMNEKKSDHVIIETISGLLDTERTPDGLYSVDMGPAKFDWRDIPLSEACDTLHIPISEGELSDPVGVSVGNPHAVFFVNNAEVVDLAGVGPVIEHHKLFPQRTNVEVVQVLADDKIRLRVWERGAGITRACGSGACAAAVAAAQRKLTGRTVEVVLDGGSLKIEWLADNNILMTGPVATSFSGTMARELLDQ
ncbi:MAG: diaminopimelate epimerase, partial [Rhodospirillaceae bacterium]|nr:diaminopimelate epimerase [Rhodospirillaceae bacterium]